MYKRRTFLAIIPAAVLGLLMLIDTTDILNARKTVNIDAVYLRRPPRYNVTQRNTAHVVSSGYYVDSRRVNGTMRQLLNISYRPSLDEDLDNLRLEPIPFLSDYKNPCWYEPLPKEGPYPGDRNVLTTIFAQKLKKFTKLSKKHYENRRGNSSQVRIRCVPYYYIIGVSKCGSSDLNVIISKHPDVINPPKKEVTFWNRLRYTAPQLEQNPGIMMNKKFLFTRDTWPLRHFIDIYDWNAIQIESGTKTVNGQRYHQRITGDATPNYVWHFDGWRKVAANKGASEPKIILAHLIKEFTPQAKIIVMIRDPIKRLWSEYNFFKKREKKSPLLFHQLVLKAINIWNNCTAHHTAKYCVYDEWTNSQTFPVRLRLGLYYLFIQDWYEVFGDQFLLLKLEDYAESRSSVTDKIFDFLDLVRLPAHVTDSEVVHNSNKHSRRMRMNPDTEKIVAKFYAPWNEKLGELTKNSANNYNQH